MWEFMIENKKDVMVRTNKEGVEKVQGDRLHMAVWLVQCTLVP